MDECLKIYTSFAQKTEITDSCWLWRGARINRNSRPWKDYGQFRTAAGRRILAHVYAYDIFVRSKLSYEEIDHLWRVPSCVNPHHLEAVTHQENTLRGHVTGAPFQRNPVHSAILVYVPNEVRLALHAEASESGVSTTRIARNILCAYVTDKSARVGVA